MIYTKEQFLAQKNEKENKNIKYSDSIELFNIDDVNKWKIKIHDLST